MVHQMRPPSSTLLHETVSLSFDKALGMMGNAARELVYSFLSKKGIGKTDVSTRFEDVEKTLVQLFGQSSRLTLVATLAKLCEEYSLPLNLDYADSLCIRFRQLEERIRVEKLLPKHFTARQDTRTYEDKAGIMAPWSD